MLHKSTDVLQLFKQIYSKMPNLFQWLLEKMLHMIKLGLHPFRVKLQCFHVWLLFMCEVCVVCFFKSHHHCGPCRLIFVKSFVMFFIRRRQHLTKSLCQCSDGLLSYHISITLTRGRVRTDHEANTHEEAFAPKAENSHLWTAVKEDKARVSVFPLPCWDIMETWTHTRP